MKPMLMIPALALACALPVLVHAQEEGAEAAAPAWDAKSKELLEGWEAKAYHLGRAGVEKASCKVSLDMQGMGGVIQASATYKWDGESGSLEWDDAQAGAMVAQQGLSVEMFDGDFKEDMWKEWVGDAELTAEALEDGGTRVKMSKKNEQGMTAFVFDDSGVLTHVEGETDPGMGQQVPMKIEFDYKQVEGKYLPAGYSVNIEVPQMGTIAVKTDITTEQIGGYWVTTKQQTSTTMGGQPMGRRTVTMTEWKFNEDVS